MRFLVLMLLPFLLVSCKLPLPEGYPEHPGEAGKETLEGIDSDGDGVRDDIKIEIYYAYPNNPVARAALEQEAKVFQEALLAGAIEDEVTKEKSALQAAEGMSKLSQCVIDSVFEDDDYEQLKLMRLYGERVYKHKRKKSCLCKV